MTTTPPPPKDFHVKLSTGRWLVVVEKDDRGFMVDEPTIFVAPCGETRERLDTLTHETLHAVFPRMTEAEVARAATDIAKVLWRAGYRRK